MPLAGRQVSFVLHTSRPMCAVGHIPSLFSLKTWWRLPTPKSKSTDAHFHAETCMYACTAAETSQQPILALLQTRARTSIQYMIRRVNDHRPPTAVSHTNRAPTLHTYWCIIQTALSHRTHALHDTNRVVTLHAFYCVYHTNRAVTTHTYY